MTPEMEMETIPMSVNEANEAIRTVLFFMYTEIKIKGKKFGEGSTEHRDAIRAYDGLRDARDYQRRYNR